VDKGVLLVPHFMRIIGDLRVNIFRMVRGKLKFAREKQNLENAMRSAQTKNKYKGENVKESGPFVCVGCLINKGATPEAATWYDYTVRAMTNMTESLTRHETPDLPREDLFYFGQACTSQ